jgi:heme-degrading monooxygenase HmoA
MLRTQMIVRIWHGRVPTSKACAHRDFVTGRAIPDYRSVPRNLSVHVLERREGEITHFITLTFWESLDAIKGFAGGDVEVVKYYPEDRDLLLEFEPTVVHYEVAGKAPWKCAVASNLSKIRVVSRPRDS